MSKELPEDRRLFSNAAMNMNKNCTYTTRDNQKVGMNVPTLIKLIQELPKTPVILTMPINIKRDSNLLDGCILVSKDIAKAFDEVIEEAKKKK